MTIHEVARCTHIKAETIRSYRMKGLIHPTLCPNGYYSYSEEDVLSLLLVRKLRGIGLPLETIAYTMSHNDTSGHIARTRKELEKLDVQIEKLQKHRQMLALSIPMLESFRQTQAGPSVETFREERIDCYDFASLEDPILQSWMDHIELFTQTVLISREYFTCDPVPDVIPVRTGLGTFAGVYRDNGLTLPEKAVRCPPGQYVTANIVLDDLYQMDGQQLRPISEFIRNNGYRVLSDTTAFLLRVAHDEGKTKFYYRIRLQIEGA